VSMFSGECSPPGGLRVIRANRNPPVLALSGELDLATVQRPVDEVVAVLNQPAPEVLVLDLTGLAFLGAAGIRTLLAAQDHASARGVGLRIVTGGNPVVERHLSVAGVRPVFDVYPDVPSALAVVDKESFLDVAEGAWHENS
jgi:anti-sigma B factor antagonist